MSDLPDPLVPADVDCTDLDGFMLNVERLMASELVALASHEAVAAALFLWCRAWKQRPAASLPNDDRVLAAFSRLPLTRFKKLRDDVMRGFVLCSDGRFYHRTLADEAVNAYERKQAFKRKRETDAERLRNWRSKPKGNEDRNAPRNDDETRFVAEGQGQGQGQEDPIPTPPVKFDPLKGETPITTAVAAVMSNDEAAIATGIETVMRQGQLPRHTAQTFIASLCKQHGNEAVVEKLTHLATNPKVEPRSWLKAALNGGSNAPHVGPHRNRSAADRIRDANPVAPDPEIDRYF
jgi:hypothetical protein